MMTVARADHYLRQIDESPAFSDVCKRQSHDAAFRVFYHAAVTGEFTPYLDELFANALRYTNAPASMLADIDVRAEFMLDLAILNGYRQEHDDAMRLATVISYPA